MKFKELFFAFLIAAAIGIIIWFAGSNNVQAGAGYATYVIKKPIFGATTFQEVLVGPASTGRSWLLYGDPVSITPYSYPEEFVGNTAAIAEDKLPLTVQAHCVWRIRSSKEQIQIYMEKFGGLAGTQGPDQTAKESYNNYIKEPFRTLIRVEVAKNKGLDVSANLVKMGSDIQDALTLKLKETPFEIMQVVVGNAMPPQSVVDQISAKVAKLQELERKTTEQEIAEKEKVIQKKMGEAEGEKALALASLQAQANTALSASLTPTFLQYQAILNMKGAEKVYLQLTNEGMPVVATVPLSGPAKK